MSVDAEIAGKIKKSIVSNMGENAAKGFKKYIQLLELD